MSPLPLVATDRASLILQLVPYLIAKGEVSLADAAADFDVAPEEMREMVEKLTVIGLPGEGGFWQMANDLFDIDWDLLDEQDRISLTNSVGLERTPRLTAREAAALLAGLQLAASLPGVGDSGVVQGLLAKLARGASSSPAEVIVATPAVDGVRTAVAEALSRGVAVSFTYQAPDAAPTTRTVDPVKVHIADGQWYLQGWCHLREAVRTFHLDRVSDVEVTGIPSLHGADAVPGLFQPADSDPLVELRCRADVVPLLGDFVAQAAVSGSGEFRRIRVRVADERSLKRIATRLGGDVEIVAPPSARAAAAEWADAGLAHYR
ncbi:WYL domain-containing protein [Microbacterium sp. EYE_5]|uniref:WYL domain-containing protein n=1 Tax=unclassified Microbacterium TaxID=2609290 RepID=UPI0020037464|nr:MULTISPECIES: WYL domain-containing protein [unclassified Microbacterium]MCK6080551.1 WYL domain-containing protein [Microbacterium sp. EYE_382]MCK6085822.1 WYL domain-containing protein [Microbacterium sp. EYE_384]MCK6124680.1 WYL domain-containing protein [Microbacterium sp. EYE_80]MCK6127589.1 WYL domain-containing protein [Microbacterium sp. EYE_79]MCK6141506.1 WYL domain-containing protein [Microbacterium sp. EYE_39]